MKHEYEGKRNICGIKIRDVRKARKITQADLAARVQVAGVTMERDSISKIEIGTRYVADFELMVISEVLGVRIESLLKNGRMIHGKEPRGFFIFPLDNTHD